MKRDLLSRIARLETEKRTLGPPNTALTKLLMVIVAHHVGGWSDGESLGTATARALGMTDGELLADLANGGQRAKPAILQRLENLAGAQLCCGEVPTDALGALLESIPIERRRQAGVFDRVDDYRL